ncbi:ATP-binding protein [Amycolatopsis sp. NBC_00345]|uniref:ATP-binding protein n=1 Tax=Amycolatopsis sp. NBC_00345 TaxID=2975955 RepID=UPI002E266A8A
MTGPTTGERAAPPPEFRRRVTATAEPLIELRRALARWASALGIAVELQEDVVMAGYEAMANTAEHAYRDGQAGVLDVVATMRNGRITVVVTDHGTWKPPEDTHGLRGRGLLLIRGLAHESEYAQRPDGTTVTMRWNTAGDR